MGHVLGGDHSDKFQGNRRASNFFYGHQHVTVRYDTDLGLSTQI